jgi:hypothetical protein
MGGCPRPRTRPGRRWRPAAGPAAPFTTSGGVTVRPQRPRDGSGHGWRHPPVFVVRAFAAAEAVPALDRELVEPHQAALRVRETLILPQVPPVLLLRLVAGVARRRGGPRCQRCRQAVDDHVRRGVEGLVPGIPLQARQHVAVLGFAGEAAAVAVDHQDPAQGSKRSRCRLVAQSRGRRDRHRGLPGLLAPRPADPLGHPQAVAGAGGREHMVYSWAILSRPAPCPIGSRRWPATHRRLRGRPPDRARRR